jgi:hypothetical protein
MRTDKIPASASVRLSPFHIRKRPFRSPKEFRAPKAYESLGGTNPRWAGLDLWGFWILAGAGRGAMTAAAFPTAQFVPMSVRGLPARRVGMMANSVRGIAADEIGPEIG